MTDLILLAAIVVLAMAAMLAADLLVAVLGLAAASALLSVVIFRMDAWLAAVFELSVCAGLISALFVGMTGLTQPASRAEAAAHFRQRLVRFRYLPIVAAAVGILLLLTVLYLPVAVPPSVPEADARVVLWEVRRLDIVGQILVLLGAVFGISVLLKERRT